MFSFDPAAYGAATERILSDGGLCELGPGRPREDRRGELRALQLEAISPRIRARDMAQCCLAALWLWHNFLDESHQISQEIAGSNGSYWHGIMHRRELDYANSKYWYRRVGDHEVFPSLLAAAKSLAATHELNGAAAELASRPAWDPYAFVDFTASVARGNAQDELFARQVATAEWQLLFDFCWHRAQSAAQ